MSGLDDEDAAGEFRRRHERLTAGLDIPDLIRIVRYWRTGQNWCKRCTRPVDEVYRYHRHDGQLSWPQRIRVLFTGRPPR